MRFKNRADAFKALSRLDAGGEREKVSGFVLLVGSGSQVLSAGEDRELAVERAVKILEEKDTVVFLSKLQFKVGEGTAVAKDQLVLSRKTA